jgi:hypothetical protein
MLQAIINWAEERAMTGDRSGLASDAIRKAAAIFVGIGVYTISELLHRAGMVTLLKCDTHLLKYAARIAAVDH